MLRSMGTAQNWTQTWESQSSSQDADAELTPRALSFDGVTPSLHP
jgi:hypothetical protein